MDAHDQEGFITQEFLATHKNLATGMGKAIPEWVLFVMLNKLHDQSIEAT